MSLTYKKADPLVHGAVKKLTCITEADKQPHHEEQYYYIFWQEGPAEKGGCRFSVHLYICELALESTSYSDHCNLIHTDLIYDAII